MSAALALADQGYDVFLVEKSRRLGGIARAASSATWRATGIAEHVAGARAARRSPPARCKVFTDSRLERWTASWAISRPRSQPSTGGTGPRAVKVKHGAAILAVGGGESRARGVPVRGEPARW